MLGIMAILVQASPGFVSLQLEHWLPLVLFVVDVATMAIEVAQMGKFAFSTSTPVELKPVKDSLDTTTAFGLPSLSYTDVLIASWVLVLLYFGMVALSEKVELQAAKRPSVRASVDGVFLCKSDTDEWLLQDMKWKLGWTAFQRMIIIVSKAGYLPLVQLLLLPLDCSFSNGNLVLDADPSQSCWDNSFHGVSAVLGFLLAVSYTIIAGRVILAGGQISNCEFAGFRIWDRSYDVFKPNVWCIVDERA